MKRFFVASVLVAAMMFSLFDTTVLAKSSVTTTKSQTVKAKSKSTTKPTSTKKSKTKSATKSKTKSAKKSKTKSTKKSKTKSTKKSKTASKTKKSSKTKLKPTKKVASRSRVTTRKPAASRGGNETFNASKLINYGLTFKGTRYKFGGMSPSGFDCSGFTSYVFKHAAGITLPHSSGGQASMGSAVAKQDLQPGDIVYFTTYKSGVSHVGIYVGDNKFLHASSSKGITVTSLSDSYYVKRYMGARRIR